MTLKPAVLVLLAVVCLGLVACDNVNAPSGGGNASKQIDASATNKGPKVSNQPKAMAD